MWWSERFTMRQYDPGLRQRIIGLAGCALLLLAAGCGFELRGASGLPDSVRSLYITDLGELRDQVEIALAGGDVRVVNDPTEADIRLELYGESFQQRVLSVDPDTGKEREFELNYSLGVSAKNRSGEQILPGETLSLTRDYIFDRDAVIGGAKEAATLYSEMRKDAAQLLLFRLRAALKANL